MKQIDMDKIKRIKPIPFIFNLSMVTVFITILVIGLTCVYAILFIDKSTLTDYNPADATGIFCMSILFVIAGCFGLYMCDKDEDYIKTDEEMITHD